MKLTLDDGKALLRLARDSVSSFLNEKEPEIKEGIRKKHAEKQGVFVTLYIEDELRGCIGFPEPVLPLFQAVVDAAKSAAFSDPRFSPLTKEEFDNTKVELSILTLPELIEVKEPEEYLKSIKIGEDGLIIRGNFNSGLLLPVVAVEYKWDAETFLENLCLKAGLPLDAWKDLSNKIYKFQSQVFSEKEPNGEVIDKM
ncbi:AMMECR1 domain-containing protein [Candidatus Woesearchaeota archaeon]|nr:AMMECR1 domain-containing protein [Candidatus Woesearchaeota archaeon]|tara:strand:+ start:12552 stop:13145 length:594 start_codon:yes stop_codon:yes gene_type:complete